MGRGRVTGIVMLTLAVVVAGSTGAVVLSLTTGSQPPATDTFELAVQQNGGVRLTYQQGPPLSVDRLRLIIRIDGTRLAEQPPIPFFAADGFRGGPIGPFNAAATGRWRPGEIAGVQIASTNEPVPEPGKILSVTLYRDQDRLWSGTVRVQGA